MPWVVEVPELVTPEGFRLSGVAPQLRRGGMRPRWSARWTDGSRIIEDVLPLAVVDVCAEAAEEYALAHPPTWRR